MAGTVVGYLPAACLAGAGVDEAKQLTHDGLIAQAGADRRSGISWRIQTGRTACVALLDELYPRGTTAPAQAEVMVQYRAFLDAHPADCALVVAMCEVAT